MQSWPNSGPNDTNEHSQWQQDYAYGGQNDQFDPTDAWSQAESDHSRMFSQLNTHDGANSNFFEAAAQGGSYLGNSLQTSDPSDYTGGHSGLPIDQHFNQSSQDVIDPAFNNIHTDLFSQPSKLSATGNISQIGQTQSHHHAHAHNFSQPDFTFRPQDNQSFDPSLHQYQSQVMQQPSRQHSQTPQDYPEHFNPDPGVARSPQPAPPRSAPYTQNHTLSTAPNGAHTQFPGSLPSTYQPQQQIYQTPVHYPSHAQAQIQSQKSHAPPVNYQQRVREEASQASQPIAPGGTGSQHQGSTVQFPKHAHLSTTNIESPPTNSVEPVVKKRKRTPKVVEVPVDTPSPQTDVPSDGANKKVEVDIHLAPIPSLEEAQLLTQFNKRSKAAQARFPSIKGAPHLLFDGSVKLPAPKSYDKLAPLVAIPSRSGKPMIPEVGYALPCEIQGSFTSQYRPAPDKGGLDERRMEAKPLLDQFDNSMKSLGKRRPKYTEYPHAFKEQLKSDEASKNKGKKAKKELEGDRSKPIRPLTRPNDPIEAAAWDAIGVVQIEEAIPRTTSLIAGRVQQIGDLLIKLRTDMNKAKVELDKALKEKEAENKVEHLRYEAEQKKEALYKAIDAVLEHADDAVLDNLGGHQKLILSLVNALISCIKAADFSGKLPKIVLELFTHFRITSKIAETTNFETVRKRFEDKGDDEVKEFVRDITVKVKKALKAAESDTSTGYTGTSASSRAKTNPKTSSDGSATKRSREDDQETRTVKKIAIESGSGSLSKKLAAPKTSLQTALKPATTTKSLISSLLPGKARPAVKPVPKIEPLSTESPPGSAEDKISAEAKKIVSAKTEHSKAAPPLKTDKPPAPKMGSAPSSSALSGIASLLDSINAPKAEPVALPVKDSSESDATPETSEEKARRLRKQARRKLRVSWKPEEELAQIRVFHKDDDEDQGREDNMIRDAADDKSEGMVLKQRADIDDDDDDDDIPYQPWFEPAAIDFSNLSEEARSKNFVTRAGQVTFQTKEQQEIADREQKELMAIYTDVADVPPSPKSPPFTPVDKGLDVKVGQLPGEDSRFAEIQRRWADEQQMGPDGAFFAAMGRLDSKQTSSNKLDSILDRIQNSRQSASSSSTAATSHVSSSTSVNNVPLLVGRVAEEHILGWLRSDKVKLWRDPNPFNVDLTRAYQYSDTNAQNSAPIIEALVRYLASKPYPATAPPDWMLGNEEKTREWWFGYNKETSAKQRKADEERARVEAAAIALRSTAGMSVPAQGNAQDWGAYYAQQQQYAPYMSILQQMTGAQQQPAQPQLNDNQLHSILAAINHTPSQGANAEPAAAPSYLNPNDASSQQMQMLLQMAQSQSAAQSHAQANPPDRDGEWGRDRERERYDAGRDDAYKDGRKKKPTLAPHKPINKALIGTKPCTFWQQGKCARGDLCTFRHD